MMVPLYIYHLAVFTGPKRGVCYSKIIGHYHHCDAPLPGVAGRVVLGCGIKAPVLEQSPRSGSEHFPRGIKADVSQQLPRSGSEHVS